jgi:transcriptional regulator with XRE-family HTH domain
MNRGAIALKVKLSERGARAKLAREFGIDQALVSHWLSGERRPDSKNRAKIEDGYAVPWRSWDDDVATADVADVERTMMEEAAAEPAPTFPDPSAASRTGTVG